MAQLFATCDLGTTAPFRIGRKITVVGIDFANTTECTMSCDLVGMAAEINSDGTGQLSGAALADHAKATLTTTGVVANGETVVLGGVTYTFKTTLSTTPTANEVLIGAAATNSLDNLKAAVNGGTVGGVGAGSIYGRGTVANPDLVAGAKTASTLVFIAKLEGTGGNSLASTETITNASFGGATFAGGAATAQQAFRFTPMKEGTYVISCTDGTNSATVPVQVWASA